MTSGPFAPAGWYDDPSGEHASRYWDGAAWTDHVSEAPPTHGAGAAPASVPARTTGVIIAKFAAALIGLLLASSAVTVLLVEAFGPDRSAYATEAQYEAAYGRAVSETQAVGVLVVLAAVAFVAPRVGYRVRDVGFMLVPVYSAVFLVRLLWRFAHLPGVYWSTRSEPFRPSS